MMFTDTFIRASIAAIQAIDTNEIENMADKMAAIRDSGGRIFILGNGGGAGHASHAVCDFRKLAGMEAYTIDSISELTARINDDGWDSSYANWLHASHFRRHDGLLIISVGGGSDEHGISQNLVQAMKYVSNDALGYVLSIVGRDGGYAKENSDNCIHIPARHFTTPITESIQSLVLHLLVSHPALARSLPKWEETCNE